MRTYVCKYVHLHMALLAEGAFSWFNCIGGAVINLLAMPRISAALHFGWVRGGAATHLSAMLNIV